MNSKPLLMVAIAAALAGCGGGGGSSEDSTPTPQASTSSAQTSATATQSATAASNATNSISNLSQISLSTLVGGAPAYRSPVANDGNARSGKLHAAEMKVVGAARAHAIKAVAAAKAAGVGSGTISAIPTTTSACTYGGEVSYSGSVDDKNTTDTLDDSYSYTMTFADCREGTPDGDGEVMNGTLSFSATSAADGSYTMSMTLGSGDHLIDAGDYSSQLYSNNFTNFYASMTSDLTIGMTMGVNDNGTANDPSDDFYSYNFNANGVERYNEFTGIYDLSYANFQASSTMSATGMSGSDKVSGAFNQSWTENGVAGGVSLIFANLTTDWSMTNTYYQYGVNGGVAVDYTPDNCAEGSSILATTTPIRYSFDVGHTTAGVMTINGTTTVTYNANGSVTVRDGSGSTTYASEGAMEMLCTIQDMEESTTTTNDTGTGQATASKLLATLMWDSPTSDMDLHVIYYPTTSPTSTTAPTHYVSYFGETYCMAPDGSSSYWYGVDANLDGYCEAGLDYDDTDGYGPEHITATSLPDGYYTVSVNSYDLWSDPSTTIDVTLDVGGTLFTFPSHTFTTSDFGGYDPNSWHRVADIRVSGGTASVVTPNASLAPYDAYDLYYYGLAYAPRVKKQK